MASYRGCRIPEELYYDLEYHVWVRLDGEVVFIGATDPAQAYAGEIIFIKVKQKSTKLRRGDILATVESAKYMGPMRAPVAGEVVAVNSEVTSNPSLVNSDPYANWVAQMKPESLEEGLRLLAAGKDASEKYRTIIDEWGVECSHT